CCGCATRSGPRPAGPSTRPRRPRTTSRRRSRRRGMRPGMRPGGWGGGRSPGVPGGGGGARAGGGPPVGGPPVTSLAMGIHEEDVAAVRAASDIVAIVSQYTPLRKVGRRWLGLCPFHSEKTPSFSVNSEENVYYCFGCQARGDVISFLMDKEQLDFPRAVESLAAKGNITLRYTDRDQGEGRKRRAKLVDTVARAVDWY